MPQIVDTNSDITNYYITAFDGDWQVCSSSSTSIKIATKRKYKHGFWYILNIRTFRTKIIGPIQLKGKNYFDEACKVAQERNLKEKQNEQIPL